MTGVILRTGIRMLKPEWIMLCAYGLVVICCLGTYIQPLSARFVLGIAAFCFLVNQKEGLPEKNGYRYLVAALVFLVLCYWIPVQTFLFFSIGFCILFLIERTTATTGFAGFLTLFLCSPVFESAANIFTFPIRLQLSAVAGKLLAFLNGGVQVKGNIISLNGNEFSVDPACMGLNMLTVSLLLGLLLLGFFQKKFNRKIAWWEVLCFLMLILALNIICNLLRILLLVQFTILPETTAHEIAGLVCLLVYVFIPAVLLARFWVNRWGRDIQQSKRAGRLLVHQHVLLLALLLLAYQRVHASNTYKEFHASEKNLAGFQVSVPEPGIVKVENETALIYVKYLRAFYDSEHNPMLCWNGSGYSFQRVQEEVVHGHKVYTSDLVNGKDVLHTAWWYSNGRQQTNSQFEWRWAAARGEPSYAIVNVTASTKEDLHREIWKIIHQHSLDQLFIH